MVFNNEIDTELNGEENMVEEWLKNIEKEMKETVFTNLIKTYKSL